MSEAVEWRIARLYTVLAYFIAIFVAIFGCVFLLLGSVSGGVGGAVFTLYGGVTVSFATWTMLYCWGKRRSGYVRSFCDRMPYLGGYDQRPLDEWCDDLEDRDAFHGERE